MASKCLNVIALVSGGKDSMYSLLHCVLQGHKVVALANLSPEPSAGGEFELSEVPEAHDATEERNRDSFMFQTAGHALIPLQALCLPEIPLYRAAIYGRSADVAREYTSTDGDEVEDMATLLRRVMERHPEANAVASGAILSTYQRTRVEDVAARLGLVSLAYLWQYPELPEPANERGDVVDVTRKAKTRAYPAALLRHMAAVGMDVRIIKVASAGLDESFLWKNLCDEQTIRRVRKTVDCFGGSILGEGGEFETLVVRGPPPLWRKAIKVDQQDMKVEKADGGEAWLDFTKGTVEDSSADPEESVRPAEPSLFDYDFEHIHTSISKMLPRLRDEGRRDASDFVTTIMPPVTEAGIHSSPNVLLLSNITGSNGLTFQQQAAQTCQKLVELLSSNMDSQCAEDHVIHTIIMLRRMSDFGAFNEQYSKGFASRGVPLPPSRVTIACGDCMPEGSDIMLSAICSRDLGWPKTGLHVQSRSYWAPANIGPYSQAKSMPLHRKFHSERDENSKIGAALVYVAGQIPLVPATMEVWSPLNNMTVTEPLSLFSTRAVLGLQHLWRIGTEREVGFWTGAVAYIAKSDEFETKARIAEQAWIQANYRGANVDENGDDEDEDDQQIDVWDRAHLGQPSWAAGLDQEKRKTLPDWPCVDLADGASDKEAAIPPFVAVEIEELPRGVDIEWQSHGFSALSSGCDLHYSIKSGKQDSVVEDVWLQSWKVSAYTEENDAESGRKLATVHASVEVAEIRDHAPLSITETAVANMCQRLPAEQFMIYASRKHQAWLPLGTVVPCRRIQGRAGARLDAAIFANRGC